MLEEITLEEAVARAKPLNRQEHKNSPTSQSLAEFYAQMPEALHNPKTPNLVIQHEKPEHRIILLLKCQGMSNREIAHQTGFTEPWISQLTRQPWFQSRLVQYLDEAREEVFDKILVSEQNNSLFTLVQLRDTATSESVRASCAVNIIERLQGKPVQKVQSQSNVFHVSANLDDINRQLQLVEEEEKRLLTQGTTLVSNTPA